MTQALSAFYSLVSLTHQRAFSAASIILAEVNDLVVYSAHSTMLFPQRTIEVTSSVLVSTTMYVHIFAFDLARAQMYALNSV